MRWQKTATREGSNSLYRHLNDTASLVRMKVVQIISLDVGKISSLNANAPSYHSIVHTVHA